MADWYPTAIRAKGNDSGTFLASYSKKGVIHTTEGSSYSGALSAYRANNSWPHFTVDQTGVVYQHVSISRAARSMENRSGGVETNRGGAIQIEVVGFARFPNWYAAQVIAMKKLMRWIEAQTGIKPEGPRFGGAEQYGLNNPLQFTQAFWKSFKGWCGHQHVPENLHWDPGAINLSILLPTIPEVIVRVPNPVAAHHRPGFGREQFTIMGKDGSMWSFHGAPWINAYNAHPELGGPVREFVDFEWDLDGFGWTQYADDGAFYHWRPAQTIVVQQQSITPRRFARTGLPVLAGVDDIGLKEFGETGDFINPVFDLEQLPENIHGNPEE